MYVMRIAQSINPAPACTIETVVGQQVYADLAPKPMTAAKCTLITDVSVVRAGSLSCTQRPQTSQSCFLDHRSSIG